MTRLPGAAARDAWRRWRTDRELILAIAGPFMFLPMFAWLLLIPEPVAPADATSEQAAAVLIAWAAAHLHWLALRIGIELFATLALLALYLSRHHRDVGQLLGRAVRDLPMFAVAVLVSWGLVALGGFAFVVPGLYLYGRVALTGAVLVAEPGVGMTGAVARSIALTHGNGWRILALLAIPLVAGFTALQVVGGLEQLIDGGGGGNPVARAIVAGLAALIATASGLARVLLQVSLYRRLATPRHAV